MKLYRTTISPYARVVRVILAVTGLRETGLLAAAGVVLYYFAFGQMSPAPGSNP